jgi:hypothetical protein
MGSLVYSREKPKTPPSGTKTRDFLSSLAHAFIPWKRSTNGLGGLPFLPLDFFYLFSSCLFLQPFLLCFMLLLRGLHIYGGVSGMMETWGEPPTQRYYFHSYKNKSKVFCFGEARKVAAQYTKLFGFEQGQFPIRYLNFPIWDYMMLSYSQQTCQWSTREKIINWKGKNPLCWMNSGSCQLSVSHIV